MASRPLPPTQQRTVDDWAQPVVDRGEAEPALATIATVGNDRSRSQQNDDDLYLQLKRMILIRNQSKGQREGVLGVGENGRQE